MSRSGPRRAPLAGYAQGPATGGGGQQPGCGGHSPHRA